jgi:hypothetical protein
MLLSLEVMTTTWSQKLLVALVVAQALSDNIGPADVTARVADCGLVVAQ